MKVLFYKFMVWFERFSFNSIKYNWLVDMYLPFVPMFIDLLR